ncbi:MAG: hypothetical protein IKX63_03950 [Muribaculaceae bacterium]|nr:hypothetical protein [Muribaculaceae bacterium]
MNYKLLSLCGALLLGSGLAMAQDYDDDIYYDGGSDTKTVKVVTKQAPPATGYNGTLSTQVVPINGVVNGRDVDEYNRRNEIFDENDTVYIEDEEFANTRRIERFHNPDIVIRSNDPDLIEYYFDNTPSVNLIVGTDWGWGPYWGWGYRYYDPWYSYYWGWGSPWYYNSWYNWGWYGGYRYHPWSYWGRPWGGYTWNHHHWGGYGWNRPGSGWYGHHGRYNSGISGRRPGINYHGNRGNTGSSSHSGYAGAPGRHGMSNGRSGIMNHGNITSSRNGGNYNSARGTMQPGNRTYHGGRSSGTYQGSSSGRSYTPSSSGRSYTPSRSSGGYSGGSRSSGGYSGGGRSSGGYSGGSHGGGHSSGGGSHGGGGGRGGRR